jgi:hypothetical protein
MTSEERIRFLEQELLVAADRLKARGHEMGAREAVAAVYGVPSNGPHAICRLAKFLGKTEWPCQCAEEDISKCTITLP